MRPQRKAGSGAARFLAPTVNSYKLHLAAVKSLVPDKVVPRPLDLQVSKGLTKDIAGDALRINPAKPENRLAALSGTRLAHSPALAFVGDLAGLEHAMLPPPAACGAVMGDLGPQSYRVHPRRLTQSAGAPGSQSNTSHVTAGDVITASALGFPCGGRSHDDYAALPERLDLDRRGLEECPLLERVEKLRLLNLQHNRISCMRNLEHLRWLVFLDLHDNRISHLYGVSTLTSLRVLMLGKNRIQRICGLEKLTNLDVLDLHCNEIPRIENLSHLSELRVLNLAGNRISRVEGLRGLDSLAELNLRRNVISGVAEVDRLPCLRRLFLSSNCIGSFDDLACLGESGSLCELTLDGNPVAQETWYRQAALRCVPHLRTLDMKRITEEERRMACVLARKEDEKKRETHKQAVHKEKRRLAIRNAAQQWEELKACLDLPTQNGVKEEVSSEGSPTHSTAHTNGLAQDPSPDEPRRVSPLSAPDCPPGGSENRLRSSSRPNSPRDPRLSEAGGTSVQSLSLSDSHLAELDGEMLRLFGPGALEALERGWGVQTAGAVTTIAFRYISFDAIIPTLPRIRVKFPNLAHLVFLETNISRLPQLAALAQVKRLDQLTIHPEGNPVVGLALWRSFLLYRLHHFNLQKLNGVEVTMNDVIAAERLFGTLGHVATTKTPRCRLLLLLEESRKRQLQFLLEGRGRRAGPTPEEDGRQLGEGLSRALFNYPVRDPSGDGQEEGAVDASRRAELVQRYLCGLVQWAADTSIKGEALHKLWPSMFVEMVRDCVLDMRDRPAFRQASLSRLTHTK
ncbi:leucine-rich repeat-containing protein 49-like isoform X2 [Denticeps clupeoides]|uniref:leucine-rich repeat-containing protein 49-like isoform X2 n=1 Tax=Denticeps clupeoides TaxID=299321 RepID=UPI0010A2FBE3|nr:leucine-rich repeat-containing protein 49-like isoform X2 [Denticeps clupeoides]